MRTGALAPRTEFHRLQFTVKRNNKPQQNNKHRNKRNDKSSKKAPMKPQLTKLVVLCGAIALSWGTSSRAATFALTASADTYLDNYYTTSAFGNLTTLWCWPQDSQDTLVRFSLAALGTPVVLTNAILNMYVDELKYDPPGVSANTIDDGNTNWVESSATYLVQNGSLPWVNGPGPAGGSITLLDDKPTAGTTGTTISFAITNLDVLNKWVGQGFVDILLLGSSGTGGRAVFSSREGLHPPSLFVEGTFTPPAASPVTITRAVILTWAYPSILVSGPTPEGPWTDVPGAVSPYAVPSTGTQVYYRTRL
jgi:hypothetical protein